MTLVMNNPAPRLLELLNSKNSNKFANNYFSEDFIDVPREPNYWVH